jgi:hypothetical protein
VTTEFDVLIQRCVQLLAGTKVLTTQVSSANSTVTNTIIVAGLSDTRASASLARYEDTWVRTLDGATEWISKVMSFAANTPANSATLTVTPVRAASNHNVNVNVELHTFIHPTLLKDDCINRALRTMRHVSYYPLGLLANPDMEDATITTKWLEEGSDAPANTEETTVVYRGTKSLKTTDSNAGNEYAYQAVNVIGGKTMYVFGFGATSAAATEAELIAYDATTPAAIDTWDFDDLGWQEVGGKIAIPAACKSLQVHLNVVTASGVVYWDDVQCYSADQRSFTLPDWIISEAQIGNVYYLPEGSAGPDEGRMAEETELRYLATPKILGSSGRFRVEFKGASIGRPLYLECLRPYEELDKDDDETTADEDTIVEGALHFAYALKGKDHKRAAREHGDNWVAMRNEPDFSVGWGSAYR